MHLRAIRGEPNPAGPGEALPKPPRCPTLLREPAAGLGPGHCLLPLGSSARRREVARGAAGRSRLQGTP